jgi:endonuclease YncB( thermonuclease family)
MNDGGDDDGTRASASTNLLAIAAVLLFVLLALNGHGFAALLIAAAGVLALPSLKDMFARYGVPTARRFKLGLCAAALSALLVALAPDRTKPTEQAPPSSPAASTDATASSDEPPSASGSYAADDTLTAIDPAAADPRPAVGIRGYVQSCRAVDGDTLNCAGEAIRLIGIDAPEMPGHCELGRQCVQGDPFASQSNLYVQLQPVMSLERVGTDRYGRTLAMVYANGQSLSCAQLRAGQAAYVGDWDDGQRVASECGVGTPAFP